MPLRVGIPYQPYKFLVKALDGLIIAQDERGRTRYSGKDATKVIQSALDALTTGRTWKETVVVSGDFVISQISLPSYVHLTIQGKLTVTDNLNRKAIVNDDPTGGNSEIEISGGTIDGNKAGQDPAKAAENIATIFMENVDGLHIHDLKLINGWVSGIAVFNCKNAIVVDNRVDNSTNDCITVTDGSLYVTVEGNVVSNAGGGGISYGAPNGIEVEDGAKHVAVIGNVSYGNLYHGFESSRDTGKASPEDVVFKGNISFNNQEYGIGISAAAGLTINNLMVKGNFFYENAVNGIRVIRATDVEIASNFIYSTKTTGNGMFIESSDNLEVEANVLIGYMRNIYLKTVTNSLFKGNRLRGAFYGMFLESASDYNLIQGNYRHHTEGQAIRLVTNCDDNLIENNFCHGDIGYGIVIATSDCDNNRILRNFLEAVTKLSDGGTGTIIKENIGYLTENGGTATFSGDGTTKTFTIPHGLAATPTVVKLEAKTADAAGDKYWTADATNITVTFLTAPPSGTNNVVLSWKAEV